MRNDFMNVSIEFPDDTYTNLESIAITINSETAYSLSVVENDVELLSEDNIESGEAIYDIPLRREGENVVSFVLVDEEGNTCSKEGVFYKDTTAPELIFSEDYTSVSTYDSVFTISGTVKDYEVFELNHEPVEVADDGTFVCDLNLQTGNNDVYVYASDEAGNFSSAVLLVTKLEQPSKTIRADDWIPAGSALLMMFIVFLVRKPLKNHKIIKNAGTYITTFLISSAVLIVLLNYFLLLGCVKSGSMEPTLMTGTYNICSRLAYVFEEPQRGDIITFHKDDYLCSKRVIGISGDEIQFVDGTVYVNGEMLDESAYLDESVKTYGHKKFIVPEGYVFVLGDNRENSKDSRWWDNPYISTEDIVSKYLFTVPLFHTSRYSD